MHKKRPPPFRNIASKFLPTEHSDIPRGFQRIGNIAIIRLRPGHEKQAASIAQELLRAYPYIKTVCVSMGVSGEFREPSIRWLAGSRSTETLHRENGCFFRIDVARVMLSKGNLSERARLPNLVRPGETIIDMFAGIGYFSIPIAKNARPARVTAIEMNPASFSYLKENIRLNRVSNTVTPILGDCRTEAPEAGADRVIMGYLPGTSAYLPAAFKALKPDGGIIHYHDTFRESELWKKPMETLRDAAMKSGFVLTRVTHRAVVKEYAPRVYHVVIDAEFSRGRHQAQHQ